MVKNKLAPPFQNCEFDIMYGEGISKYGDMLDIATEHNIVQKSGTWYSYGDLRLGQGRENVKAYLKENPEFAEELEVKVRKALNLVESDEEAEEAGDDKKKK